MTWAKQQMHFRRYYLSHLGQYISFKSCAYVHMRAINLSRRPVVAVNLFYASCLLLCILTSGSPVRGAGRPPALWPYRREGSAWTRCWERSGHWRWCDCRECLLVGGPVCPRPSQRPGPVSPVGCRPPQPAPLSAMLRLGWRADEGLWQKGRKQITENFLQRSIYKHQNTGTWKNHQTATTWEIYQPATNSPVKVVRSGGGHHHYWDVFTHRDCWLVKE